jgi:DNA-binding GntR family transcriptional regulator
VAASEDFVVDIAPPSLVETVMDRLRDDIISGELAPGDRIVEEQLTRRFGISRAPLREALRLLGQQGLVEHLPRRGVRVATLSEAEVDELFELRDVLEQYAITVALSRLDLDFTDLDAALDMLAHAVNATDSLTAATAHRRFHLALVELAGHRHLLSAYEPVLAKLQLYMATNLQREADLRSPAEGLRRHRRLRDALAGGDLAVVLRELADHGARRFLAVGPSQQG